eukprot:5034136-Amphidinium_carterae.1
MKRMLGDMLHNMTLVFGHGLSGVWPCLLATLRTFSVWANSLEGHMPELRLGKSSAVLLHSNYLSCKVPWNGGVESGFSIALVGNRFKQPSSYPPWITRDEHSTLFCVSQAQGVDMLLKLVAGSA